MKFEDPGVGRPLLGLAKIFRKKSTIVNIFTAKKKIALGAAMRAKEKEKRNIKRPPLASMFWLIKVGVSQKSLVVDYFLQSF